MHCQKCGTEVVEGAAFCPKCGANTSVVVSARKRSKHAWKWFAFPLLGFILILVLWGLVGILVHALGAEQSIVYRIFKLLIPILIVGCVLMLPVGIVVGIVLLSEKK